MVFPPIALVLATGLSCLSVSAQSPSAMLDGTKASAPAPNEIVKPQVTPELRGDIFMAKKQYTEAIEAYREGASKDPVLANKIGIAYHQMQNLDSARKSYQEALRLNPKYPEAMNNLGAVYYSKKSYRRAISWYQKAIKASPDFASFYSNLGTAYFARKLYEQAMESFRTAMRLNPDVFEQRSNYGTTLQERTVEERAKFHYYIARMYAQGGRNELALQYLRKALEEGFKDRKQMEADPDFAALRELPEFKQLLTLEPRVL